MILVRSSALAAAVAASLFLPRLCQAADLYGVNPGANAVDVYDATTGAPVQTPIASADPGADNYAIAASGGDLFVTNVDDGTVSEYNATTGATVNASLISGLTSPTGIAVSGDDIFVTNANGYISEYTTSGALVNPELFSFFYPLALTVSGNDLFVTGWDGGWVGEFTTSGQTVNGDIVSGLDDAFGIAVAGNDMYITSRGPSLVAEYTTSGALVNGDLINAGGANGIAYYGGNLYVSYGNGIGEYNATTGAPINAAFVSLPLGQSINGIVVTPEPSTWIMLAIGGAALLACSRSRMRHRAWAK